MAIQSYRPDVVRMIADELGMAFCDFRTDYMAPLGWQAATLPLNRLDQVAADNSTDHGIVLHNVEALLAAKPEEERKTWLSDFLELETPHSVIVPLSVFFGEAPQDSSRVAWIEPADLPNEMLLTRLALR